jgi:hypothetical protein
MKVGLMSAFETTREVEMAASAAREDGWWN